MTDKQIISGIKEGDEKCFKELVDKHQELVLNTCNSFLHNVADAEDLTQDVFISALKSVDNFKGDSKISTWLYRIATNKSLNHIRDSKKRKIFRSLDNFFNDQDKTLEIPDNTSLYNDVNEDDERIDILHKAIGTLQKNQKIAFTLSRFEKLSYQQISDVMNISLAAVEGLIHRAKKNVEKKTLDHFQKKIRTKQKF
jgi:RNA polymerase sigma-70 factor (ECF subfamily)